MLTATAVAVPFAVVVSVIAVLFALAGIHGQNVFAGIPCAPVAVEEPWNTIEIPTIPASVTGDIGAVPPIASTWIPHT
jgi:hypothetical protein